jgi:Mg2+ and Co2+ transporter CorA
MERPSKHLPWLALGLALIGVIAALWGFDFVTVPGPGVPLFLFGLLTFVVAVIVLVVWAVRMARS